jgi:nucleoside-diphosphate-sugar epimerase
VKVLFLGGTGTISTSCVAEAIEQGLDVYVLNRGQSKRRPIAAGAKVILGDAYSDEDLLNAISAHGIEVVADFLCFDGQSAKRMVRLLAGKVKQYVFIGTASSYQKPIHKHPITESSPLSPTGLSHYSQLKIDAEDVFNRAYVNDQFPVTTVRPSHTYDDASPPLIGDWTNWDRVLKGKPVFVSGDGTNLWTVTHAEDFAVGFVGLLGNWPAIGEDFHITSQESPTWEEIYANIGLATGVTPKVLKLTGEQIKKIMPDWFWADQILGDLSHTAIFDNTKIKKFVPRFNPKITWVEGARRLHSWHQKNHSQLVIDAEVSGIFDRVSEAHARIAQSLESF